MIDELNKVGNFLFSASKEDLEKLNGVFGTEPKWIRYIDSLSKKSIQVLNNGEHLKNFFTVLKNTALENKDNLHNFDIDLAYLFYSDLHRNWFISELSCKKPQLKTNKTTNSSKYDTYYEIPTEGLNIAWIVVFIVFVQSAKKSSDGDFEQQFVYLIKEAQTKISYSGYETKSYSPNTKSSETYSPAQKKRMSLILAFGYSYLASLVKIKEEQKITDNDYELLVKGMEWYWFGEHGNDLTIPDDEVGNMCWLRFDFLSFDQPEIKGQCRLALKNLIKEIKNSSVDGIKINTGGYFQFRILSDKGFTKL